MTDPYSSDTDDTDLFAVDPALEDPAINHYGPFDIGWRTAVYPAGTVLADAVTAETAKQAAQGKTLDPATVRVEPVWFLPTQSFPNLPQDVVSLFGAVVFTYRLAA